MSRCATWRRVAALALFGLAALLAHPLAQAATTCSATMTDLSFGAVVPNGAAVPATATLNYSCTYSGLLGSLFGDYVRLCFSIGTGSAGGGYSPRTMTSGAGDTMNFQMYTDAAHSAVWGGNGSGFSVPQATMLFSILSNGVTQNGSLTLYGLVPAAQAALGAGSYQSQFNAANTQLTYAYNEVLLSLGAYPTTCTNGTTGNGSGTFPFTVSATVQQSCSLTGAGNLGFGSVASNFSGNIDASSTITMNCIYRTSWQVGLDNGQHAAGTTRRMIQGAGTVVYELYRDNGRSQRWGNTLNTDTQTGSGTGSAQSLTVYGRVLPQSGLAAGSYADKITVTVTF
jgi:spore coat protein U-like protein